MAVTSKHLLAALALVAVAAIAVPQTASADSVTFTQSQAATGSKTFSQSCATCHGEDLEGGAGPALTGDNFKTLSSKVKATVGDVFTYMTTNMPMNAPASLTHDQYTSIMAFILSKNGYKPGSSALTYQTAINSHAKIVK